MLQSGTLRFCLGGAADEDQMRARGGNDKAEEPIPQTRLLLEMAKVPLVVETYRTCTSDWIHNRLCICGVCCNEEDTSSGITMSQIWWRTTDTCEAGPGMKPGSLTWSTGVTHLNGK